MPKKIESAYIVDDDSVYVYGLQKLIALKSYCHNILVFSNGLDALSHLKAVLLREEGLPDVILLDINMPVMDGWQFMEEFAKIDPGNGKKITVYMISTSIEERDKLRAEKISNISGYIIKPTRIADLEKIFIPEE